MRATSLPAQACYILPMNNIDMRLFCFQSFEYALKSWSEKTKSERPGHHGLHLSDEEANVLHSFVEATATLIKR